MHLDAVRPHRERDADRGGESGPDGPNPAATGASAYNGWLESYNTTSTGALSYLAATWVVPQTPAAGNDGQVLFFFNGLEGLPTVESILQPVLAYENGQWFAQSWNCCAAGTTYNANTIPVSPGDVIVGTVSGANCNTSTGLCNNWTIETLDQRTGQSSVLQTSAWGVAENWVFAGVLEVYGGQLVQRSFPFERRRLLHEYRVHDRGQYGRERKLAARPRERHPVVRLWWAEQRHQCDPGLHGRRGRRRREHGRRRLQREL